jgi:hypothetical protein
MYFGLRAADYSMAQDSLPYTQALALAIRGHIEGIASPAGKIKYLRLLAEREREPEVVTQAQQDGRSTAFARTNMGAYREAVESTEMDSWGIPTRIIIGHIWQLHGVSL